MSYPKHRRKRGTRQSSECSSCHEIRFIKAFNLCKKCYSRYKHRNDPICFLNDTFHGINKRCNNPKSNNYDRYKDKLKFNKDEFIHKFKDDSVFLSLFKTWQDNDFSKKDTPSIDRIDNLGDYTLNNTQFLRFGENAVKDKRKLIELIDNEDNVLKVFNSLLEASEYLKIGKTNISAVVRGLRTHSCGYRFRYA